MSETVHAIYENGVFRPVEPVDLPDRTAVQFEPRVIAEPSEPRHVPLPEGLAKIYEILGRRYRSGSTDTAARHNEIRLSRTLGQIRCEDDAAGLGDGAEDLCGVEFHVSPAPGVCGAHQARRGAGQQEDQVSAGLGVQGTP